MIIDFLDIDANKESIDFWEDLSVSKSEPSSVFQDFDLVREIILFNKRRAEEEQNGGKMDIDEDSINIAEKSHDSNEGDDESSGHGSKSPNRNLKVSGIISLIIKLIN